MLTRSRLSALAVWTLAACPLSAQKCPDPVDPLLVVQAHAVADIVEARREHTTAAELADFARHHVQPPLGEGHDLGALGDAIVACRGTPQQQAWIERFFQGLRTRDPETVTVLVEMLKVPAAVFERELAGRMTPRNDIGSLREDRETEFRARAALHLADAPREWLRDLPALEGVEVVGSPGMRRETELGQSSISVLKNHSYVRERELDVVDGRIELEPIEDVVRSGFALDQRNAVLADGSIALDLKVHLLELHEIRSEHVVIAQCDADVQRPRASHWRIADHLTVPEDGLAAYAIALGEENADRLVLLVRAVVDERL